MAPALGIEPSRTASKAVPTPSGRGIANWYGRWDSNPRTHGLNVRDMPLSYARIFGGNGRTRTSVAPKDRAFTARCVCRSATSPRYRFSLFASLRRHPRQRTNRRIGVPQSKTRRCAPPAVLSLAPPFDGASNISLVIAHSYAPFFWSAREESNLHGN